DQALTAQDGKSGRIRHLEGRYLSRTENGGGNTPVAIPGGLVLGPDVGTAPGDGPVVGDLSIGPRAFDATVFNESLTGPVGYPYLGH
ncbi:MAG: hypothetical protein ACREJP_08800, partial [Candidatus Methylomirabilales bacterium]